MPGLVPVAERGGRGGLVLELDEAEPAAVARLPVPHHDGGAHLPEAGEVRPQLGLLRRGRDAAHEELAALAGGGLLLARRRASGAQGRRSRRRHRRRRARVLERGGVQGGGWMAGGGRVRERS